MSRRAVLVVEYATESGAPLTHEEWSKGVRELWGVLPRVRVDVQEDNPV